MLPDKTQQAMTAFTTNGIAYELKGEEGLHLVVEGRSCPIDYWPTTGKWKVRNPAEPAGYSLRGLINYIIG